MAATGWGACGHHRRSGGLSARPTAIESHGSIHGGSVQTDMLHGDVIIGMAVYDELDHALGTANYADLCGYRAARQHRLPPDDGCARGDDGSEDLAAEDVQRLYDIASRPDADVRREVLRALRLDSLLPLTVDVQVSDGVVTLAGTVGSQRERTEAVYLAGCVPGVIGVLDDLACRPQPGSADAVSEAVAAALACTAVAEVAELTVDAAGWGTVVLSGAVQSRTDHGLAIATALSVPGVEAVDDCIQVEC